MSTADIIQIQKPKPATNTTTTPQSDQSDGPSTTTILLYLSQMSQSDENRLLLISVRWKIDVSAARLFLSMHLRICKTKSIKLDTGINGKTNFPFFIFSQQIFLAATQQFSSNVNLCPFDSPSNK